VTDEIPLEGSYAIDEIEEDNVILPVLPDGSFFSFENLRFVFSSSSGDRVFISNAEGHVDSVCADPVGFPVDWTDKDGEPCPCPKAHPVGLAIESIDEDGIVTCKLESSSTIFKFENPVRDPLAHPPSHNTTVRELESQMNERFDTLESSVNEMKATLAHIASKLS
jgi:hypothetical protein